MKLQLADPRLWLASTVFSLLLVGCSGQQLRNCGADLADSVRFRVGAGLGLYSEVQLTSWIHPAVGFADANLSPRYTVGWDPRAQQPAGTLRTAAFPTLVLGFPFYRSYWQESGFEDSYTTRHAFLAPWILMGNHYVEGESCSLFQLHEKIPNPILQPAPGLKALSQKQRRSRDSWIAISGTLGVATFDFGINPLELVDAVFGLICVDLLDDDERQRQSAAAEELPEQGGTR